jgi:hypothetical protein
LAEDEAFLSEYLRWLAVAPPRSESLHVVEQRLPGEAEGDEELSESDQRRLPDAWIYTDSGWALLIESKIASPIDADQLRGHLRMAERRGFTDVRLLVLSPAEPTRPLPGRCFHRQWRDLYRFACAEATRSTWASHLARYMPVAEQRMVDDGYLLEGTLTTFAGIPFSADYPYSYLEAKRLLRLLMLELRTDASLDAIGINRSGEGRKAITGSVHDSVWDFLPLTAAAEGDAFTDHPHFTLVLRRDRAVAQVTLPHGLSATLKRRLRDLGYDGFRGAIAAMLDEARSLLASDPGAAPQLTVLQRRYATQRSIPIVDALMEIDPRTALAERGEIKLQEQWLRTAFDVYANRQANIQMSIGVAFPYAKSSRASTPEFVGTVAEVWRAARPLLEALDLLPGSGAPGLREGRTARPARAAAASRNRRG